jgi:spermidine/putrescine transport system substrate-binding protein
MKKFLAFFALFAALIAFGSAGCSKQKKKLFVYNWSYYIPDDVLRDFEKKFNCEVVYDTYESNEEMYTKIKGGASGYDIVFPSGDHVSIMSKENMLEKIDKSKIPNFAQLDKTFLDKISFDKGNVYSVPFLMGASGIAVNKAKVKDYKKDCSIFDRKDLKSRMTMLDDAREVIGAALAFNGYSVNSTKPEELKKAKATATGWRKNLQKFDASTFGKSFAAGEFWVVQCYPENVFKEVDESMKKDIDFFIPSNGGTMYMDNMAILKSAKNKELAYEFINYIHTPEVYARIADFLALPSINIGARSLIKKQPIYPFESLKKCEMIDDIGDKISLVEDIWRELKIQN